MKKLAFVTLLGLFAVGLTACDSNTPTTPTPTPVPVPQTPPPTTPPAGTPYTDVISGTVINFQEVSHRLVAPRDGTATFKLTWTSSEVDLDLGLTADSCTSYFNDSCIRFAESAQGSGTSEELVRSVKAGDVLRIWVINYEHSDDRYSLGIDIR